MYLKAVEIFGFKSFGEKVYIEFNRGITSIVGPNGSGKSNILDAVLWVLGEQSYKNIRAKEEEIRKKSEDGLEIQINELSKIEEQINFLKSKNKKDILNELFKRF